MWLNSLTLLRIVEFLMLSVYVGASQVINLRVDEESQIRTTIGNISAYLLPKSKFTIDQSFFTVTSTGMVQVARRIDLETLCSEYTLCCARDRVCQITSNLLIESETTAEIAILELVVRVVDVNDNPPSFPLDRSGAEAGQVVKISELAEVGTLLNLIPATDNDIASENRVQRYTIHGRDFQGLFELDSTEPPNIRLRLLKPLDYETTQNYTGSLEAYDGKSRVQQKLTVLVIDANDNKPAFLKHSYTVTLPENTSVGETVVTLLATDNDSLPNAQMDFHFYSAVDPDLKKTFRLEKRTGNLILQSRLGAHQRSEFRFSVGVGEAIDPLLQSTGVVSSTDVAQVVIMVEDVNDFSPVIKMMSPSEGQPLIVRENEAPSRIAVFQVTDNDLQDNGRVQCHLIASSSSGTDDTVDYFHLENRGKLFTLSTTKSFNAEKHPHLSVSIVCSDFGKPRRSSSRDLTIQVEDVNEFLPEVEKSTYYATVLENTKAGVEVVQVTAHDRDYSAKLFYELSNEGKQYFTINQTTGVVTTLGDAETRRVAFGADATPRIFPNSVLDREKTERITFKVCVTDGPPTLPCGMTDSDQQKSLSTSRDDGRLVKNPIQVIHTAYSTVFVTVLDENDNRPKFIATGPFSVMENQPRFTKVNGRLAAIDLDEGENGQVRYSLHKVWISANNQATPDLFQVDAEGVIRTMDVLDRELTNAYTLALVACDSAPREPLCTGFNATVTVLDENDNQPEWHYPHDLDKEVNITSNLPPGHVIARVLALDRDTGDNGRVVYSLIDPHRRTVFQVDNATGEVAVIKHSSDIMSTAKGRADTELPENPLLPGVYRLRLRASDLGHPTQAAETWLQVNVFGAESVAGASVNLFIIIIMISVTGAISACLVVAIICVRRRSSLYRTQRRNGSYFQGNGTGRSRSNRNGTDGANAYPLKHEYGYPLDGAGYVVMGVSPAPSELGAMKLNSYHQAASSGLSLLPNGVDGHEPISLLGNWTTNPEHAVHCPHVPMSASSDVGMSLLACTNHHDQIDNASASFNLPVYAPCPLTSPDNIVPMAATLLRTPPAQTSFSVHPVHYPTLSSNTALPASSMDTCLRFSSPSPITALGTLQSFGSPNEAVANSHQVTAVDQSSSSLKGIANSIVTGADVLRGPLAYDTSTLTAPAGYIMQPNPSVCCHQPSRRYATGQHPQVPVCELDVDSADSGRGTSEDDPGQLGHHFMHFYPNLRLSHTTTAAAATHHISSNNHFVNSDAENATRVAAPIPEWNSTGGPELKC